MTTKDQITALRGDVQECAKLIGRWMQAYAENERLRELIAAALAIDVTEDWDALERVREILEKA